MLKLYVGGLSFDATEDELRTFFTQAGTLQSVNIMKDTQTGRPRGFAFVEMASDEEAKKAIAELNGKEVHGRSVTIAEARPPRQNSGGGYGGGRKNYGGGKRY